MKHTEVIRELCAQKGISIAKLEKDLGLGNGTIASSKSSYMRSDRLKAIADYFNVSMEYLMTGEEPESLVPDPQMKLEGFSEDFTDKLSRLNECGRKYMEEQLEFILQREKYLDDKKIKKDA